MPPSNPALKRTRLRSSLSVTGWAAFRRRAAMRRGKGGPVDRLVWIVILLQLIACSSSSRPGATPQVRGAFFAISTGDRERLVAWYCDNLGFKVDSTGTGSTGVKSALLSRRGAILEILQLPTAKSRAAWGMPDAPESVHGILKIGFEVDDLNSLYEAAVRRRVAIFFAPVRPSDNRLRTFGVKDPDGNIVQFFGK